MVKKYDDTYDGYSMPAIANEGAQNWPHYWTEDCDESFKKYKKSIDAGKTVDVKALLKEQSKIFSNMSTADKERCNIQIPKQTKNSHQIPKKKASFRTRRFSRRRFNRRRFSMRKQNPLEMLGTILKKYYDEVFKST